VIREVVAQINGRKIMVMDSISVVTPEDTGAVVVSASHGGVSSAEFALQYPLAAVFFNDAGFGKDEAGAAALSLLEDVGVSAATISYMTARIGDCRDTWANGVVSRANGQATRRGVAPGQTVRDAAERLAASI
jgi:hypothetical protein